MGMPDGFEPATCSLTYFLKKCLFTTEHHVELFPCTQVSVAQRAARGHCRSAAIPVRDDPYRAYFALKMLLGLVKHRPP